MTRIPDSGPEAGLAGTSPGMVPQFHVVSHGPAVITSTVIADVSQLASTGGQVSLPRHAKPLRQRLGERRCDHLAVVI